MSPGNVARALDLNRVPCGNADRAKFTASDHMGDTMNNMMFKGQSNDVSEEAW